MTTALLSRLAALLLAVPRGLAWIPPLLWGGLIWWLSSRTPEGIPGAGRVWPLVWNLGHAVLFGLLALLLLPLAPREDGGARLGRRELAAAGLAAVLYGLVDEWRQAGVPGRDASALDLVTDAVGVACVLWIAAYRARGDAGEAGLRRRLLACAGLCLAAAGLASVVPGA